MRRKTLVIISATIIVLVTCFLLYAKHLSSEVLDAFGVMNEKIEKSNAIAQNEMDSLRVKLNSTSYANKLKKLDSLSSNLTEYVERVKQELVSKIEDPTDYSKMDKSSTSDVYFFLDNGYTKEGKEFVQQIDDYNYGVKYIFENEFPELMQNLDLKLNNREDITDWLEYNFKGFPLVAVLTNLTQIQVDIKQNNKELLLEMLSKK